jgi:hypothetical protein
MMSASTPNQPNTPPDQPTKKKKVNPRGIFFILIIIAVAGYLIALHHTPGVRDTTTTNTKNATTNTSANVSIPDLQNLIATNFTLTNSIQENEILVSKNGEIYLQISGYFNQFPNSYSEPLSGKLFIIYMEITVYNGSSSKSVVLPVFTNIDYNNQRYFVYQAEGNLPQLQTLVSILKQNEFIAVTFYTNTSIQIQGYTVW